MARIDDFKARFPNFDTAVVDSLFPVIEPQTEFYYGGDYDNNRDKEIMMQLWAHLITIENRDDDGAFKSVASKAVGSVNVSYESSQVETGRFNFFHTTRYGQQFLYLINTNQGAKFV